MGDQKMVARLHAIDTVPVELATEKKGRNLVIRFCPPGRAALWARRYMLPVLVFCIEVPPR